MKKILISLSIVGAVAAIVVGATTAFFSDTETSPGNTLTAGSLDLKLNGYDDPHTLPVVEIEDLKPSIVKYSQPITLTVVDNPGKLYKHIVGSIECNTGDLTEPECTDQGGTWTEGQCDWQGNEDENYLPAVTWFDLEVGVDENENDQIEEEEWQAIIPDREIILDDILSKWIYLGTFGGVEGEPNKITIRQSFHLRAEAENEYQGDSCSLTEEFMVLQTNAPDPAECWGCPGQ